MKATLNVVAYKRTDLNHTNISSWRSEAHILKFWSTCMALLNSFFKVDNAKEYKATEEYRSLNIQT